VTVSTLVTIGVYGFTAESFFEALTRADVRLLLDVRQRRGVRGSDYAWANSARLQASLAEAGIAYGHHRELAPSTELRRLQYAEDDRLGVGKRSRVELAAQYTHRYTREILDRVDLEPLVAELPRRGRRPPVRRARSRGLPSIADRRAARDPPRRVGRARPSHYRPLGFVTDGAPLPEGGGLRERGGWRAGSPRQQAAETARTSGRVR
jgi:hypothetical protein